MFGAGPRTAAWLYLTSVGNIVAQLIRSLVINNLIPVDAEEAHLTPWRVSTSTPSGTSSPAGTSSSTTGTCWSEH